jgi:hypothetical protein
MSQLGGTIRHVCRFRRRHNSYSDNVCEWKPNLLGRQLRTPLRQLTIATSRWLEVLVLEGSVTAHMYLLK